MPDSLPAKPVLAVQRYSKQVQQPRHEPETEEATEAYKDARSKSREALMLDIRFADGKIVTYPYHSLRKVTYDPTGVILLRFDREDVIAEGKNLLPLRDAIKEHRARFIQEGTATERGLKPQDEVHIDRIVINEGEEDL
jgi:hypothetical protein